MITILALSGFLCFIFIVIGLREIEGKRKVLGGLATLLGGLGLYAVCLTFVFSPLLFC